MNALRSISGQPISASRWIALAVAVLITLTGGILYGNYSQRWNIPAEMQAAVSRLGKFPRAVGHWKTVEDLPIEEAALQMLECKGYINRRYVNEETGKSLQLAIMVGPPGPIAVHTPEICYSSRSYEVKGERTETALEDTVGHRHSFWTINFTTRNAFADGLRVYYAWSDGRKWNASNSPRFEFAGAPLLYKLQLASYVSPYAGDEGSDPCRQFLEELLDSAWVANKTEY